MAAWAAPGAVCCWPPRRGPWPSQVLTSTFCTQSCAGSASRARLAHAEWLAAQAAEAGLRWGADQVLLTPRQRGVAALISAGLTHAEIAHQLVLDTSTVATHVAHILHWLGFRIRMPRPGAAQRWSAAGAHSGSGRPRRLSQSR